MLEDAAGKAVGEAGVPCVSDRAAAVDDEFVPEEGGDDAAGAQVAPVAGRWVDKGDTSERVDGDAPIVGLDDAAGDVVEFHKVGCDVS